MFSASVFSPGRMLFFRTRYAIITHMRRTGWLSARSCLLYWPIAAFSVPSERYILGTTGTIGNGSGPLNALHLCHIGSKYLPTTCSWARCRYTRTSSGSRTECACGQGRAGTLGVGHARGQYLQARVYRGHQGSHIKEGGTQNRTVDLATAPGSASTFHILRRLGIVDELCTTILFTDYLCRFACARMC
jgi:hypothetical protein